VLTYTSVRDWTLGLLTAALPAGTTLPTFLPGPFSDPNMQDVSPNELVFLHRSGAGPMTNEKLFDAPIFVVYVIGAQGDFDSAETLALLLDQQYAAHDSGVEIGGVYVKTINRAGGGPAVVGWDPAERWHFSCSYVFQPQSDV
jgi:hypothetical protein